MADIINTNETPQDSKQKPTIHIGMRNIKTAFAAVLCALIYYPLHRNPTFACIGAVFGMGGDMGQSRLSGGNRFFGTIFGGFIGMALFRVHMIFQPDGSFTPLMLIWLFIGVVTLIVVSTLAKWPGAIQPGGVMLCIILFNTPVETFVTYSLNRIVDTGIGVLIALLVNYLFPKERWIEIKEKLFNKKNS